MITMKPWSCIRGALLETQGLRSAAQVQSLGQHGVLREPADVPPVLELTFG